MFFKKDGDKRVSCAGWLKTIGILAVTAGGFVIYYGNKKKGKSSTTTSENKVFGEILLIGNCVCCSIYVLLQKKWVFSKEAGTTSSYLSKKWSKYPINLTAWTYLFGALFMLLHAIILIIENTFFKFRYFISFVNHESSIRHHLLKFRPFWSLI